LPSSLRQPGNCLPRGAGGAKRSYDYLKEKGIAEEGLLILEKGMAGWSYPETTVAN